MALASGRNASQYFISLKRRENHSLGTKCWKAQCIPTSDCSKLASTRQSKNVGTYSLIFLHSARKNTSIKYTNLLITMNMLPYVEHNVIE